MSIDQLHNRIRKLKNPSMVSFEINPNSLPPHILQQEETFSKAYNRFCLEILQELKDIVPAVRFSSSIFFMLGGEGIEVLSGLLDKAKNLGYYVVLDAPEILSPLLAETTAKTFASDLYSSDAVIISPYIGSDAIKPFIPLCKEGKRSLFCVVRSPNKSASELQDLQFGTRQAYVAAADLINRHGESVLTKCGFSQIGTLVSAGNPEILRRLRSQFPHIFMLVDGLDYPSGNAKNCSFAFNTLGYGAIVCVGSSITKAWKENSGSSEDYLLHAKQAAERIKRNLTRYVNIL